MEALLALNSVSSKFKWVTYHVLGWSYVFFQVSSATVSQPKTHKRSWYNFLPDSRDSAEAPLISHPDSRDSAEAPLISHSGSDWYIYIYIYISVRGYSQVYKHELHVIWNRVTNGIGSALVIFYEAINFRARAQAAGPALGWARLSSWPTQMIKGEARVLEVKQSWNPPARGGVQGCKSHSRAEIQTWE